MLDFLVNRGWLGLLNTSRAELPKTFAILLMGPLSAVTYPRVISGALRNGRPV